MTAKTICVGQRVRLRRSKEGEGLGFGTVESVEERDGQLPLVSVRTAPAGFAAPRVNVYPWEELEVVDPTRPYRNALACQDGSNLLGILRSFARDLDIVVDELRQVQAADGTGRPYHAVVSLDIREHPAVILYASKLAAMTGCETMLRLSEAYDACVARAKAAE